MAFLQWNQPVNEDYLTLPSGVSTFVLPSNTMVKPFQNFSVEALVLFTDAGQAGTTVTIHRSLSSDAITSDNNDPLIDAIVLSGAPTGKSVYIRDIYGLVANNLYIKVTAPVGILMRLTVLASDK